VNTFYVHTFKVQSVQRNNSLSRVLLVDTSYKGQELAHINTVSFGFREGEEVQIICVRKTQPVEIDPAGDQCQKK
jgi:hypothetical protein